MLKILIDLIKLFLEFPVFRRLLVVFLLPNVLVFGFAEIGIDNNKNFLWYNLVGPYWFLEKAVVCVLFLLLAATILAPIFQKISVVTFNFIAEAFARYKKHKENKEYEEFISTIATRAAQMQPVKAHSEMNSEEQAAYNKEKKELENKWNKETADIRAAKKDRLRQQRKEDRLKNPKKKRKPKPISPDDAKNKALRDITGRGA